MPPYVEFQLMSNYILIEHIFGKEFPFNLYKHRPHGVQFSLLHNRPEEVVMEASEPVRPSEVGLGWAEVLDLTHPFSPFLLKTSVLEDTDAT